MELLRKGFVPALYSSVARDSKPFQPGPWPYQPSASALSGTFDLQFSSLIFLSSQAFGTTGPAS